MNVADAAGALCAEPTGRRRVLLAEDVDSNATWEQDALELFGCDVLRVADGATAVAWGTRTAFDLILMDCRMPVMDGAAATQAIRQFEAATRRTRTPIVAVTASVMPAERQHWLAVGMDDVLAKPVLLAELERMLDRWTVHRKNRWADRKITCLRHALTSSRMSS